MYPGNSRGTQCSAVSEGCHAAADQQSLILHTDQPEYGTAAVALRSGRRDDGRDADGDHDAGESWGRLGFGFPFGLGVMSLGVAQFFTCGGATQVKGRNLL